MAGAGQPSPAEGSGRVSGPAPFGRRDWLALAFLAALALGFHGRPAVTGLIRVGGDLTIVRDPLRVVYVNALRQGRLALWAPNLNLGTPLFAESQLGQLHPINLVVFSVLPVREGGVVWLVVACFLGGASMYLSCRGYPFSGFAVISMSELFTTGRWCPPSRETVWRYRLNSLMNRYCIYY